jgi:hypothetical protein
MPIYSNVCSGKKALHTRKYYGRRKYFTPAATRGDWKEHPAISWSRQKRLQDRDNAAQLDANYHQGA